MPSSLIVVGLVIAWLVVLVPIVARKRSNSGVRDYHVEPPVESIADSAVAEEFVEPTYSEEEVFEKRFRPGRGGYDIRTAQLTAQARYSFRRRVVSALLLIALATGLVAGFVYPVLWWAHAAVDAALISYLAYLRRQVRIEENIRARRQARLASAHRYRAAEENYLAEDDLHFAEETNEYVTETHQYEPTGLEPRPPFTYRAHPSATVVDVDDIDPIFVELDRPYYDSYRRAVGE